MSLSPRPLVRPSGARVGARGFAPPALLGAFCLLTIFLAGCANLIGQPAAVSPTSTPPPTATATPSPTPMPWPPPTAQPLDALSTDLAAYVAGQGANMGVAVYDVTQHRAFATNDATPFILASSAKVYIMCAYLDLVEGQQRALRNDEVATLTNMIEQSDNNAAQLLYIRTGYDAGERRYLQKIGISGYVANPNGWGWAEESPAAMVRVLGLLYTGQILTPEHRQLALNLLGHIESDQRMGIGVTAPAGATYAMKDGWVPGPDNLWALNSSGIVTVGAETYILAVYSQHQPSYDWSKVEHVCGAIAALLTQAQPTPTV
jgi:beta-lactamase class A